MDYCCQVLPGEVLPGSVLCSTLCHGDTQENLNMLEMASGISWAVWIFAFFIFMFLPQYWFIALMLAAVGIVLKVTVKMSLVGTMWGEHHD